MLTGDKVETAVNIGVATGLLNPGSAGGEGDGVSEKSGRQERPVLDWGELPIDRRLEDKISPTALLELAKETYDQLMGISNKPLQRRASFSEALAGSAQDFVRQISG